MSRKQKSIFTVSILLNIVFLGMIAAFYFCAPSFVWQRGPVPAVAGISPEARALVRETFHSAGDEMRGKFREAREARGEVLEVLSADTFDPAAYDAASARLSAVKQDLAAAKARVTRELAEKLPAADRRKIARGLAGFDKGVAPWMGEGPHRGAHRPGGPVRAGGEKAAPGSALSPSAAPPAAP
jgi:uncharacterized membrane protein